MLSKIEAEKLLLDFLNQQEYLNARNNEHFAIIDSELSPRKDYWVIRANNEAYVKYEDLDKCYVGTIAYLIDRNTNKINPINSNQTVDAFLQRKYDRIEANGKYFVLQSGYAEKNKKAIIKLHQVFNINLKDARELIFGSKTTWFTGQKTILLLAQEEFKRKNIITTISLIENKDDLPDLGEYFFIYLDWKDIDRIIKLRIK